VPGGTTGGGRDRARLFAIYGFGALISFLVISDRFAPIVFPEYEPIGDTALGLLLGSMTALILTEAIDNIGGRGGKG